MKYAAEVSVTVEAADEQEAWEKIDEIVSENLNTNPAVIHWSVSEPFEVDDDYLDLAADEAGVG